MSNLNLKTAGIKPLRRTPPNALLPYLPRWQSNNSPSDLGIARFIFDLHYLSNQMGRAYLYKDFRPEYGVANWAKSALHDYFIWERGMTKEDRAFVYATYRGGSKTTWFVLFLPLYECLVGQYGIYYQDEIFPEYDYQMIKCKNSREAEKRLMTFSSTLNQSTIIDIFGNMKPTFQEVKNKDAKDTGALLILSNGFTMQAAGILQPSRGANILGARPDKITFDDPQNKDNTKTPSSREDCDKEVMEESFGAITDDGTIVYIGNKVHEDDTIGKLLDPHNSQWKKQFHTLTYALDENNNKIPGKGDLDKEYPDWSQRYTIEQLKKRKAFFEKQPKLGGLRSFLKEYYNIIKSDADYRISFHHGTYVRKFNMNWIVFKQPDNSEKWVNCYITIGNDPAISERKGSSDAVITVVAFASTRERFVLEESSGKYDIHDRFYDDNYKPANGIIALEADEKARIKRRGSVEEVTRMAIKYHADSITVETAGQQGTFFNEIGAMFDRLKISCSRNADTGAGRDSKTDKNRECPLAYFEAGLYYIRESMLALQSEINSFPSARQDRIDAIRIAEKYAIFPPVVPYSPIGINLKPTARRERQPYETQQGSLTNDYEAWVVY